MKASGKYAGNRMKDYYKILEVNRNASAIEIKKSYRRLAALYHPDKNDYQKSNDLFQEINEAYQVLGNQQKKEAYDWELEFGARSFYPHIEFESTPPKPRMVIFQPYIKYARIISIFALVFCLILAVDYFLPPKETTETINKIEKRKQVSGSYWEAAEVTTARVYTSSFKVPIASDLVDSFPLGSKIKIYQTRILSTYIGIERRFKGLIYTAGPHYSIYKIFVFLPVILFICSFLGTFYLKKPDLNFSLGVVNFILLIITFTIALL